MQEVDMLRSAVLSGIVTLLIITTGCGESEEIREEVEQAVSSSDGIHISAGVNLAERNACRTQMMTLATSMEMYMAMHGNYPQNLEDLREVGGTVITCPGLHVQYILNTTEAGNGYTLKCPDVPSHGSITDGDPGWN